MVPPAIALATVVAGCSPTQPADVSANVTSSEVAASQVAAVAPNSKEALEQEAHQLDVLASQAQAAEAYEYYSQRCKGIIGDLDSYKSFLAVLAGGSQSAILRCDGEGKRLFRSGGVDRQRPKRARDFDGPANLDVHRWTVAVRCLLIVLETRTRWLTRITDRSASTGWGYPLGNLRSATPVARRAVRVDVSPTRAHSATLYPAASALPRRRRAVS